MKQSLRKAATPNLLAECRRTLVRHRRSILFWALAGLIVGILVQLPVRPVHRATVSVEIEAAGPTAATSAANAPGVNIDDRMKLFASDRILARVEQRLVDDPDLAPSEREDWLSQLQRALHLGGRNHIPLPALIDQSAKSVHVRRPGGTQIIEVSCESWDAAFAAEYCNTLAQEFQKEDLESRGALARQTSDLLMQQASEIQARATDAQRRLEASAATDRPGAAPQKDGRADQDRLRQLQAELVRAQADRMTRQAQLDALRLAGSEVTPEIAGSAAYTALQARLEQLQNRLKAAEAGTSGRGTNVLRLRSELRDVEAEMSQQRAAAMRRLQSQFEAAKHREDLLALSCQELAAIQPASAHTGAEQLRREVEHDKELYRELLEGAQEAGFNSATRTSAVRVVQEARKSQPAVYPRRTLLTAAGLLFGLLAGLGVAFIKDRNRTVLRLPGESRTLLGVEELGVIPSPAKQPLLPPLGQAGALARSEARPASAALRTAHWDDECSLVAEAYRNAMLSVMLASRQSKGRVYIMTSPGAGEGKSTVTTNLGVALSKSNLRVVLIDGDLRRPNLHRTLSVPNGLGLRNILRGEVNLAESPTALYCKSTAFPNLCVIPAGGGRGQLAELLHTTRFGALMQRLSRDFEVILVDTPPILHISDARVLAQSANGAILVFRSGSTSREDALRAREILEGDRVPILGTILNDFNPAHEGKYGYYKSYYAYQQQPAADDKLATDSPLPRGLR